MPSFSAMDECGFNLRAVPHYAYAPKSKRAVVKRPGKRGSNYTLTLCVQNIESKAVIGYKLVKGGIKLPDFHNFLSSIELKYLPSYAPKLNPVENCFSNIKTYYRKQRIEKGY